MRKSVPTSAPCALCFQKTKKTCGNFKPWKMPTYHFKLPPGMLEPVFSRFKNVFKKYQKRNSRASWRVFTSKPALIAAKRHVSLTKRPFFHKPSRKRRQSAKFWTPLYAFWHFCQKIIQKTQKRPFSNMASRKRRQSAKFWNRLAGFLKSDKMFQNGHFWSQLPLYIWNSESKNGRQAENSLFRLKRPISAKTPQKAHPLEAFWAGCLGGIWAHPYDTS